MVIKVIKPRILHNEFHPEHEEKDVVEPITKTSEDVHGGDEITQSMEDQRFAQQQNENQTQSEQQQNNQQNENQQNNETQQQNQNASSQPDDKQTEQQNNNNQQSEQQNKSQSNNENQQNDKQTEQQHNNQSQNNNDSGQNQQTEEQQQNNTQQTNESQQNNQSQANQQQNELQNNNDQQNETNQQQSEQQQTNENQQTEQQNKTETNQQTNNSEQNDQQDNGESQNETNQNDETEEQTLDDSVSDDYQEQEDEEQEHDYDEEEQDDYYEDDEDQEDTTQYNTQQAFKINEKHSIKRQLYLTFYRLVEYLSDEEKQPTLLPGQTLVLNVKKLMMRQYERKPLNAYYYFRTRSQVFLILDNSGSMTWLIDELDTFFKAALKRKDVIIYVAPNGYIVSYYNDKTKRFEEISHEDAIQQIIKSSLPVVYIGDFDGANTPIELSWTNRVYWICPETRYKYFSHHNWVGRCVKVDSHDNCKDFQPYYEDDFKGFFGRTFDDEEMITVLKEFAKNVYKQRFWYDKHDIEDFSEERENR